MNTIATGRKAVVLVLATLLVALAVFAGASASTATVSDAHAAKEKGPSVQMKQMICGSGGECPW